MNGQGFANRFLTPAESAAIVQAAATEWQLDGKRVLALIPDHTRSCPLDRLYRQTYEAIGFGLCQCGSEGSGSEGSGSESGSGPCVNPYANLPILTSAKYALVMGEDNCLGWLEIDPCSGSGG